VRSKQAACTEKRRIVFELVVIAVIPLDALDLVAGSEHESNPLVRGLRLHFEDGLMSGAGAAARLLDEKANRLASYNSRTARLSTDPCGRADT